MRKTFFIKDSAENQITFLHLLVFMLALPFDRLYSTLALISLCLHTAIFFSRERLRKFNINTILLQSMFFITLFALPYSGYFSNGVDVLTKQLAIFLFPVLLTINQLNLKKYYSRLLLGFSIGCAITVLLLFADAFHVIIYNKLPATTILTAAFLNHNFSAAIDMHATYLSMLLVIALVFLLRQLLNQPHLKQRGWYIAGCLIVSVGLVQLAVKSVWLALIVIVIFGFPWLLIRRNRVVFVSISLLVFGVITAFVFSHDALRNRYVNTLQEDLHETNGISMQYGRLDRWDAAAELIKTSPLAGHGSGSEISLLRDVYLKKKMYAAYLNSVNVHSQYLSLLINSGIAGLLIYLLTLGWGLARAIREKDILLFSFIVLVATVSFAEDVLDVNKGIFFYAFFFSFLTIAGSRKKLHYISAKRQPAPQLAELYN